LCSDGGGDGYGAITLARLHESDDTIFIFILRWTAAGGRQIHNATPKPRSPISASSNPQRKLSKRHHKILPNLSNSTQLSLSLSLSLTHPDSKPIMDKDVIKVSNEGRG
jgi:hypothetical protein